MAGPHLDVLDTQTCALSAIEIEDALRERDRAIGRASIYGILDELERLHVVQKLQVGQAMARYEPIRTGDGHHHHLVCDNCGTVTPFTDPGSRPQSRTSNAGSRCASPNTKLCSTAHARTAATNPACSSARG
jgi:Fe2+ or Zn2+ uptake regulation protein